jgi:hypothetical protein
MKRIYLILLPLLLMFAGASCSKEGCNNIEAENFDAEADQNDGSCSYSGNVNYWCLPYVSDSLFTIEGHVMLRFELEGEIVDSIATQSFFAASGQCGLTGTKTIKRTYTGNTERYYKYRIKGNGFTTIYEDIIEISANECTIIQLN